MDVMSYDSVEAAAKQTAEAFGTLDVLINNAGYLSSFVLIAELNTGEWWRNYEVNLRGVYLVSKAF
jgi:NAD(P)-dependent dehydrogenase (short-subunit alcohol dehydrogenase family)